MNTLDVNMCCSSFDLPRGYNQALYDKVSNMITLSGNYVRDNQEKICLSIVSRSNNNVNKMYSVMLNTVDKEINHIEKHCDLKCSCTKGCSACCSQAIFVPTIEGKHIVEAIYKLPVSVQNQIREKTQKVILEATKKNFPTYIDENSDENKLDLEYLSYDLSCPLLGNDGCCLIYESRPTACQRFRNYGNPLDCKGAIAPYSYAFDEYAGGIEMPMEYMIATLQHIRIEPQFAWLPWVISNNLKE